jgi:hypothetical protein
MRIIEESGLGRIAMMSSASNRVSQRLTDRLLAKPYAPRRVAPALSVPTMIRSSVLCESGAIGLPCQGRTSVPNVGLSGLGFSVFGSGTVSNALCSELQAVLDPMGRALSEARRVGASGGAVSDAQTFYDRETTFATASNPWLPQKCRDLANDASVRLAALNSAVSSAGGQMVRPPAEPGSGGPGSEGLASTWMGTLKTVAIAAAVIAGVAVVAPIVWEAVAVHKARR